MWPYTHIHASSFHSCNSIGLQQLLPAQLLADHVTHNPPHVEVRECLVKVSYVALIKFWRGTCHEETKEKGNRQ